MARNRKVSTADLLVVFADRSDPFEPLTASEVAEEVDLSRRAVSDRLEELAGDTPPALRTKKTGAKGRVWWVNADVWYPSLSGGTWRDVAVERVLERVHGQTLDESESDDEMALERALADLDLPGSGEVLIARREAIREMYLYLREEREAAKRELCELVDPDEVGYQDRESFWSNLIIRHDVMRTLPNVVPPGKGGHYYHYIANA
ncbi:hypothetical protein [Halobacteriaceae bacterium SHR40]|uniref:hypothetical protein n=1 Tax=Halovenus amylolytica TaxID=2500550 RepID=UPI000FE32CD8